MIPPRVLIVDGDPKELERHAGVLAGAGYTVLKAGGSRDSAGILRKHRGNLVVLSRFSPEDGCGIEFLKDTLKSYPSLPFTFLVSFPFPGTAVEAMQAGAFDLLPGDVPEDVLRRCVTRSAQRMEEIREKESREKEIRKRISRIRKQLMEAQALSSFKGFMISMAAHDFRTILTVLDGYLQLAREKCGGCPVSGPDGMLHHAGRTVARLQRMANTILDYEALETGRFRAGSQPVPLGEVLRECAAFYRPLAEQMRIDLALDWEDPEILVQGDRMLLLEILDNLVYNALKFTPGGGSIRVSGNRGTGTATVTVRDTGPGIPKEKLATIFRKDHPFAPGDPSARWGLGLKICKCLVEAQNGRLQVDSVFGQGTRVSFSIPSV